MNVSKNQLLIIISHGFQSTYERDFCNALAFNSIKVLLISSDRTLYDSLDPRVETINLRGSQEENRTRLTKLFNMVKYHLKLLIYTLLKHNAIVHVIGLIDPPLICGIVEGIWFRFFCKRYVLTVHNLLPHDKHTKKNKILNYLTFKIAKKLVVHTEKMQIDLHERFNISLNRITLMEHGVSLDKEVKNILTLNNRIAGSCRILFFGKIAPYKGLDILLDALQDLPFEFELTIAGTCIDKEYSQLIENQIKIHPSKNKIIWNNCFIPENEIPNLFINNSVLVLPYRHIDQSGVLFQALKFGLPIIASDVGQFSKYISHEVGELFEPNNVQELRNALLNFEKRKTKLSRLDILTIAEKYDWTSTVQSLDEVY